MNIKLPEPRSLFKSNKPDQHIPPIALAAFIIITLIVVWSTSQLSGKIPENWLGAYIFTLILIGVIILYSLKVASAWEKAVVLRLGKFMTLRGPGLFLIIPIID